MRHDDLDRLLDDALATYTAHEPRTGLPGRVLARVHHAPRRHWLGFALAAAAAALLAVWGSQAWHQKPAQQAPARPSPPVMIARVDPPAAPHLGVKQVTVKQVTRKRVQLSAVPQPELTHEERLLLAFVAQAPDAVRGMSEGVVQPIEIDPIVIQPLHSDGLQ